MSVNATFKVELKPGDDSSSHHASIELAAKLNLEQSQFQPGDTIYWYLYASDNLELLEPILNAGSMRKVNTETQTREQMLQFGFPKELSKSLDKPAQVLLGVEWFGSNLGTPTLQPDGMTVMIPKPKDYKQFVNTKGEIDTTKIGILYVTYSVTAIVYELTTPNQLNGRREFPISGIIPARPLET